MGVITLSDEIISPLPAEKLFQAFVLEQDHLSSKVLPQFIKNAQLIGGDGGPGSIKHINFAEGSGLKKTKGKIDAVDKEKLTVKSTVIEGDSIIDNVESVSVEGKYENIPGGGSKLTTVSIYYPKPGAQINQGKVKELNEKLSEKRKAIFKTVEGYLLADPAVFA